MRAGTGTADLSPPLGLPMVGFVRRQTGATKYGLPLEASLLLLEEGDTRVVLCGVDTLGIPSPEVDELRERIAHAAAAAPEGVLLNWNHTHCAPPACRSLLTASGLLATDGDERIDEYWRLLVERIVAATTEAVARLEPAMISWGIGEVDLSVNRRERGPEGSIVHGWRADGLLDRQVVVLQARRPDESVIGSLVGYACHSVAVGMDFLGFSGDFPSALRRNLRAWTGGECVFFQGAAGNVLPRVSFVEDESEAERMGRRLAVEASHAVADRRAWPSRLVQRSDGSLIPMLLFRFEELPADPVQLQAVENTVSLPLLRLPREDELATAAEEYGRAAADAEARGAGPAELYGLLYHAKWAERSLERVRRGVGRDSVDGPIHAVRIGEGAVVSAPGEAFTEIGLAVRERSPASPTLYAGYTNGAVGYFPTASAYAEGGYEPVYSNRSYGRLAPVAPACERLLVETAVRLVETLFPDRPRFAGREWSASGRVPALPPVRLERPPEGEYAPPATARHPGTTDRT